MYNLSVIVPVYNTEKYIKKCLDSLVNQKMDNIEIIVINDGSIDGSEDIIKQYVNKYTDKIKYYKKENGGLSSARNYGIKYATGKYITFVDSDDYVDENLYFNLKEYMDKNVDLIKFKTIKLYENNKKEKFDGPTFYNLNGQDAFNELYAKDLLLEPAWLYLYRRDFWNNNNFKYTLNTYHEDFGLTPLIICNAKTVDSTNIFGYYYIQRDNSIITDKKNNFQKANDLLVHYDNMLAKLKVMKLNKRTEENIKIYYANALLLKINELNSKESNEYIKKLKKRKIYKNIKIRNFRQLIKKLLLFINVKMYLKLR